MAAAAPTTATVRSSPTRRGGHRADGTDEVTFAQRELPTITGEMLNALRLNGKTLVVEADNYTIRIAGRDVKNTSAQVSHMP